VILGAAFLVCEALTVQFHDMKRVRIAFTFHVFLHSMPWLPLYADSNDFRTIREWLNASEEVAYIVGDGPGRWRAVGSVPAFGIDRICLWHVPSGALGGITNPWNGWQEMRAGADPRVPYFGAGDPGVFWLNVRPTSRRSAGGIGLSSFEWIGNHYRCLGRAAAPSTERFWRGLRRWAQKHAKKVPRTGLLGGPRAEIFAFPFALAAFGAGVPRDDNP